MAEQLAFDLPVREARGRTDFFVSPANATALAAIESWDTWPMGKLVLVGPLGSGKTHLAHVWAALTGGTIIDAAALNKVKLPMLASGGAVCIEDADCPNVDEHLLLHLHNLLIEERGTVLFTAATPPRDWSFSLRDLQSRVVAAPVAVLAPPDDALLRAVLLKQFADRQLRVSPALVEWLVSRIERSFAAVKSAVEQLDAAALSKSRPLTRALAAQVLDNQGAGRA